MTRQYIKHALWGIVCCVLSANLNAGSDIKYRVADIPKPLLKDAKAVVRNEEIVVEIKSNEKLVQKVKYAITILNKNGESNGYFKHPYDKNIKVGSIKSQLYDENGNEYKKKGGFETLDYALISGGTTYDDNRIKAIDPEQYVYPFTIEYTYEVTFNEVIQFPGWHPVDDYNLAVEKSTFTLSVPNDAVCRFYESNIATKARVETTATGTIRTWELVNATALSNEDYSPALEDITPLVLIAPSKVNVEGYEGNLETWQGFGMWINKLNQGRNNLSEDTKVRIRKLVSGITSDREKIKILYEYMQNKTRYVSINVGIGGFQPFDAATVDRLSYGDCKALSYYLKSLLEVVGIDSRYTLVQAGEENPKIYSEFPSNQFNHVMLCVPLNADTLWLECTSQTNPFNYQGMFSADRLALVIDENGGTLVKTRDMLPETNLESRSVKVILDAQGGGSASTTNIYRGSGYDYYSVVLQSDQADRKKYVTRSIHVPNFELDNFNIRETKAEEPFVTEQVNISMTNYCTSVGGRLMLTLNMMNKLSESPFQQSNIRKTPISIKWPVYEIDTVTYELPQGYTLEKIPAKISLKSDFGSYTTEVTKTGSSLRYVRVFKVNKAEYPVERYDEIVTFFDKVVTADENKVMLTKVL